jgi:mycofactocin precursor peptide peptidase
MPALRRDGVRAVTSNGVLGDPTGANARAGSRIFEQIVAAVLHEL